MAFEVFENRTLNNVKPFRNRGGVCQRGILVREICRLMYYWLRLALESILHNGNS